ncbi:MAG: hypothetical protein FJX76_17140 [Armatimonadetes bacterium]|nr:hypothetical protein [Armatimonadota bacterium]
MFHNSRYGVPGESLPGDLNGNVPEEGDDWLDFAWSANDSRRFSESPQQWKRFVADAVARTQQAARAAEGVP